MNNREQEIEDSLRLAPCPVPPAGLRNKLMAQMKLPDTDNTSSSVVGTSTLNHWLRRWWPALVPAAVSAACAVAITVQQQEFKELKQNIQQLSEKAATSKGDAPSVQVQNSLDSEASAARYQQEIEQLKQQAGQLKGEIAQLEKLRTENTQLRSQLAKAGLPPELQEFGAAMQEARDKAMRINCVNNMKQIGLAVRLWEQDNDGMSPPNFLVMSNELGSTKIQILVCPADTNRQAGSDWASLTAANCSYEYLGASEKDLEWVPNRVLTRCPIHGTIGLSDGSVQQISHERASEFVQRDGKLYMGTPMDKQQSMLNACINNLRQIDGAKQQWALENRQTAEAIPTAQDIVPYLRRGLPPCPMGGRYTLNAMGAPPTCTIPGHALPR